MNKQRLLAYIRSKPNLRLEDLAYTASARRLHHSIRSAYTAASLDELEHLIEADIEAAAGAGPGAVPNAGARSPVVFAFSGQGQLHAGMGAALYRDAPAFRDKMNTCVRICESFGFPSFIDIISNPAVKVAERPASETQLAIVCLEISLAAFWASCGIVPELVIGHSLGEYAALHAAGILSLADTLLLVGKRALLMEKRCVAGAFLMLSIAAPLDAVHQLVKNYPGTSVSCINGPDAIVVSGPAEDIPSLQAALRTQRIRCTVLPLPYAFHSGQLDPILDDYTALARTVPFGVPKLPFASTLLGDVVTRANHIDGKYLVRQTREAVDFIGGVQAIDAKLGDCLWLELGPASVLIDLAAAILPSGAPSKARMASSLKPGGSPWTSVSAALATAYEAQQDIDWAGLYAPHAASLRLVDLPLYAFDLKNYWRPYPARADAAGVKTAAAAVAHSSPALPTPPLSTCLHHVVSTSASLFKFRSSLSEPQLKALIDGHRLMDVPISPACVLGEMALTAAAYAFKRAGHQELKAIDLGTRDCVFLKPVSVDPRSVDQEVTITVEILIRPEGVAEVKMYSDTQQGTGLAAAQVKVHIAKPKQLHEEWSMVSRFIWERCAGVVEAAKGGRGQRLTPAFFYSIFGRTVRYSAAFQRIVDVFLSPDMQEGVAEVVLAPTPESCTFTLNPYWVDSLTHLAGFLVNGDPAKSADSLFMMNSYGSYSIVEPLEPDCPYIVYTRVVSRERKSAIVNVYVFREERLVMQNLGLHLQEIPTSLIARMIGKTDFNKPSSAPVAARPAVHGRNSLIAADDRPTPAAIEVVGLVQPQQLRMPEANPNKSSLVDTLLSVIAGETGCELSELTVSTKLADLGVDSIMAIQIAESLQAKLGLEIGASLFHEHPTLGELQTALASRIGLGPQRVDMQQQYDTLLPTQPNRIPIAPSPVVDVGSPSAGGQAGLFEVLLSAIATETGAEPADIDTDFTALTDLGVDSIMAMQITTAVREQTGIDIHPSILVQNPTIGALRRTLGQDQKHHEQKSTRAASGSSTMTPDYVSVEPVRTPSPATSEPVMMDASTIPSAHSLQPASALAETVPPAPAAAPKVNVVLMQGRKSSGHVPLFMFPDGAGGASTYMYLKRFRNDRPLYVLESPYLHNPQDFTGGVEEVSTLFKQAVLDVHPSGNFLLAGYSGGAIYAYETARQLILDGHTVQGLLLFDMAVPRLRPDPGMPPAMSLLLPAAMVKARNWADPVVMRNQQAHMAQMVRTVAEYDPVPMPPGRRPHRTWLTWCKRGVIERLGDDARRQLRQSGILTEAIPDFMEDPAVGPFAWAIPPGKPLGPNGWDKLVGNVRCTSIDADHFTMIIPPDVAKFQKALEDALVYCNNL